MKKEIIPNHLQSNMEYPGLTDVSKALNVMLGDKTNRTVSRRTAHGFRRAFKTPDLHEDIAETIVHAGMVATVAMLNSKSDESKLGGLLLLLGLGLLYIEGEEPPLYL